MLKLIPVEKYEVLILKWHVLEKKAVHSRCCVRIPILYFFFKQFVKISNKYADTPDVEIYLYLKGVIY